MADHYAGAEAEPFGDKANALMRVTSAHGRLVTGILVIGEFERELIRARTDDGRKRAMARGVRFGRKPKLTRDRVEDALARRKNGEPLTKIGRSCTSRIQRYHGSKLIFRT